MMELINRNPLIICIGGKAKSGKSLVGKYISNKYNELGFKVVTSQYTKYLKQYISEIIGDNIDDNNKPRSLLQDISSELIKNKLNMPDFFINRQLEDIDIYSYFFDVIIISDVRFPREIEILKDKYKKVISIGVIRDNYDNGLTDKEKNDITETSLDNYNNYDYVIYNNGENLYKDTINIVNNLREEDIDE